LARTFDEYIREAQRLQTAYQDKIALLVGLETDYITSLDIDGLDVLLKRYGDKVDYLVGSIHHANAMPIDLDRQTFNQVLDTFGEGSERMPAFLSSYLDAQYTVLQRFHPEIIGHFDVCRLYHPGLDIQQWPTVWAKVERNVRYAIEYGALFELNASAFKYGWSTAYPGQDVVQVSRKASVALCQI
jgi:histidinol-phosphatase (PHP family)